MKPGFRADIEGLRAVALGAVLLAHAGVPIARGGFVGVDVFFVISGFLITGLLVRELERTGTISLRRFWSARVRRLLPLAALVLVAVIVGTRLFLSPTEDDLIARQVIASALYVVNWVFMAQSVDYFGQDVGASPVQHFWTLAIEEQFYLVWPGLLLAATWWWRRRGASIRRVAWALVAVIGIGSFAYGVAFTGAQPEQAYFSTFARAWELALGAAIALAATPRLGRIGSAALGWAGLAAIAAATVLLDGSTPFPGFAALLPTLGAAALIVAGTSSDQARFSVAALLSTRVPRHVGRISYGWYLWHWPPLIFAAAIWGPLSVTQGLAVVLAAYVPTVISHWLVERPFHHAAIFLRRRTAAVGLWAGATGVVAVAAVMTLAAPSLPEASKSDVRGARAVGAESELQLASEAVRPAPDRATKDRGPVTGDGCFLGSGETRDRECAYGKADSKTTVVLFGDSHAMHFFPAVEPIAEQRGWRLVVLTKAGCPPTRAVNGPDDPVGEDCERWREAMIDRITTEEKPALVVMSGATGFPVRVGERSLEGSEREDALAAGYTGVIEEFREAGSRSILLKDPPAPPNDAPACVADSLDRLERCAFDLPGDREETFEDRAAKAVPGTEVIDVTPKICRRERCAAVVGDALVYRNKGHLTATFAETLAPSIGTKLPRHPR